MDAREREPVLVADAGSASVHLTVFANDGTALASYDDMSTAGDNMAGQLRDLLRYAPAPTAVGHRIVHGGPELRRHTLVDEGVRDALQRTADLAPKACPAYPARTGRRA